MKSVKYGIMILALVLAGTVQATVVTRYSFEKNDLDTAGGSTVADDLVTAGGSGLTYVSGIIGYAGLFAGDSFMGAPDSPDLTLGPAEDFAMDFFMKGTSGSWCCRLATKHSGTSEYELILVNGKLTFGVNNVNAINQVGPDLRDGQWHHICISNDTSDAVSGLKAWEDGVNVSTGPGVSIAYTGMDFGLGDMASCGGPSAHNPTMSFIGRMDEFRIQDVPVDQPYVDGRFGLIPEPATMILLGLGGLATLRRRRR